MYDLDNDTASAQYGTLTVFGVEFEDEGIYTCIVSNTDRNVSVSASLQVQGTALYYDYSSICDDTLHNCVWAAARPPYCI